MTGSSRRCSTGSWRRGFGSSASTAGIRRSKRTAWRRSSDSGRRKANARAIPPGDPADMALAYRKAVTGGLGGQAAALLCRIALDRGLERALHLAVRPSLDDLGRLGHNLAAAAAHSEAASALRIPRGLIPLANLGHAQAAALRSVPAVTI